MYFNWFVLLSLPFQTFKICAKFVLRNYAAYQVQTSLDGCYRKSEYNNPIALISVCKHGVLTSLAIVPGPIARLDAWHADGRGFDPRDRQHFVVGTGHEIISTAILFLPLIQVGQLSVNGERMCA